MVEAMKHFTMSPIMNGKDTVTNAASTFQPLCIHINSIAKACIAGTPATRVTIQYLTKEIFLPFKKLINNTAIAHLDN